MGIEVNVLLECSLVASNSLAIVQDSLAIVLDSLADLLGKDKPTAIEDTMAVEGTMVAEDTMVVEGIEDNLAEGRPKLKDNQVEDTRSQGLAFITLGMVAEQPLAVGQHR